MPLNAVPSCPRTLAARTGDTSNLPAAPLRGGTAGRSGSDLDQDGVALAATGADCGAAETAPAALELAGKGTDHAGTGSADRVTERHCTAVDVDFVLVDAEHLDRVQRDRSESLVDFPEVDVGCGLADLRQRGLRGERRGLGEACVLVADLA